MKVLEVKSSIKGVAPFVIDLESEDIVRLIDALGSVYDTWEWPVAGTAIDILNGIRLPFTAEAVYRTGIGTRIDRNGAITWIIESPGMEVGPDWFKLRNSGDRHWIGWEHKDGIKEWSCDCMKDADGLAWRLTDRKEYRGIVNNHTARLVILKAAYEERRPPTPRQKALACLNKARSESDSYAIVTVKGRLKSDPVVVVDYCCQVLRETPDFDSVDAFISHIDIHPYLDSTTLRPMLMYTIDDNRWVTTDLSDLVSSIEEKI